MKKRILIYIMTILMLAVQLPIAAEDLSASTAKETNAILQYVPAGASEEIALPMSAQVQPTTVSYSADEVKQCLIDGLTNVQGNIDISQYNLMPAQLKVLMQDILYSEPELFYVSSGYNYSYDRVSGCIVKCMPQYTMSQTEIAEAKVFYEAELAEILLESGAQDAVGDLEKALLLHDYLASNYAYDTSYTYYDAYSMLKYGKAVCQGYTLLYDALLTECGITVGYAHSERMQHIWNLVKLGDNYYHVDVTWADPIPDRYSKVNHKYFMKSDADFVMNYDGHNAHTNWTSSNGITCNDTTYDSAVWQDVQAPFVYLNGSLYYIDFATGDLCRFVGAHQKGEALMRIEDRWYAANGAGYYPGIYSSLAAADGKLYFTTSKTVGCFDPKTNTRTNDLVVIGSGSIVGILRSGETSLIYAIAADIAASSIDTIGVYNIPVPCVPSDLNEDGVTDKQDVKLLLDVLSGVKDAQTLAGADINEDGCVNAHDLYLLMTKVK